ncbi:MAG: ATP-binding protein [Erythrobacter sp.]
MNITHKPHFPGLIELGRVDFQSLAVGLACALATGVFAYLTLVWSQFYGGLTTVWLAASCAVAVLLKVQLRNEGVAIAGLFSGVLVAGLVVGLTAYQSVIFAAANALEVLCVLILVRRSTGALPGRTTLTEFGPVAWLSTIAGPAISASVASYAMIDADGIMLDLATNWFFAHALSLLLIVPTVLVIAGFWRDRADQSWRSLAEAALVIGVGLACAALVFMQSFGPLLIIVPPFALLCAFRAGSIGAAVFVGLLAVIAIVLTSQGLGPIYAASSSNGVRLQLLQAFIAVNFLTGLPVAVALAGRVRIMENLSRGKQEIDLLAENINDAILRYDLAGVCTYASNSVLEVLGEDPQSFVGRSLSERVHSDARERILTAQERMLSGDSDKERFTYRRLLDHADGSPAFVEAECALAINPLSGESEGIVVSTRDVTERVELELLLTRARRHAENAAWAKSEFLANMSHEIRTPMNGVLGFAELMLQSDLDDEQRRHAQMIVESGRSMMLLLNDILDLSKIEAGQIAIDPGPCDLSQTIEDCVVLHRADAKRKGIALEFEFEWSGDKADASPPFVQTDGLRVRQIVLNLIGNAVKFTEAGHVHVYCDASPHECSVRVSDTGIGISSQRLDKIFWPFTQGESDTLRRFGGTGLGLTISRRLAELLGGSITVESEEGVGSCFVLKLPTEPVEELPSAPVVGSEPEANDSLADLLPQASRILLVEDHDVNRFLMIEMLERCGQFVEIAHDGHEAITMVIDGIMRGNPFELVLMDIQMPGCDGYEATRAIRSEGIDATQLPIVALTANAFPDDIGAARNAGMQAHLAKPVVFADLAKALQRWLPTRIVDEDHHDQTVTSIEDYVASAPSEADQQVIDGKAVSDIAMLNLSPELMRRWQERRSEAIEAVRDLIKTGALDDGLCQPQALENVTQLIHKLAGSAAMCGEPELGEHSAVFERALTMESEGKVLLALAVELLAIAENKGEGQVIKGSASQ